MSIEKEYDKFISRIAGNVVRLRKSQGLTQEDMVELGYSYRHYQRIESGKHSPNLLTLFRLAKTFEVEVRDFFK